MIIDKSGTLEGQEVYKMVSDSFRNIGKERDANSNELKNFLTIIDKNGDGRIQKDELFDILNKALHKK